MKIEKKKEQKRAAILRSAWSVFMADGYIRASMDKIAHEASVTKQTVYRYFDSKESLYRAALEARRDASGSSFLDELKHGDLYEGLRRFAVGFLKVHLSEEHVAGVRLMFSEGPKAPEMVRARYAVGPAKTEATVLAHIKKHTRAEDPEYAVKMLLSTLLSMRVGVAVGLNELPSDEAIETHAARTVGCLMNML